MSPSAKPWFSDMFLIVREQQWRSITPNNNIYRIGLVFEVMRFVDNKKIKNNAIVNPCLCFE